MDRTSLDGGFPRDWLNQSLKTEPNLCDRRRTTTAYFTASTGQFEEAASIGNQQSDYSSFALPRLPPHPFSHAFVPTNQHAPECGGTLTRAHAMHSLFETYTIEGTSTRQHASVRLDDQIMQQPPPPP
uniref:Uncharacterized protein n=1 Tax=Mesocestoides corti TaxID=53468 RepID=A0A5K3FE56_MESCO